MMCNYRLNYWFLIADIWYFTSFYIIIFNIQTHNVWLCVWNVEFLKSSINIFKNHFDIFSFTLNLYLVSEHLDFLMILDILIKRLIIYLKTLLHPWKCIIFKNCSFLVWKIRKNTFYFIYFIKILFSRFLFCILHVFL